MPTDRSFVARVAERVGSLGYDERDVIRATLELAAEDAAEEADRLETGGYDTLSVDEHRTAARYLRTLAREVAS